MKKQNEQKLSLNKTTLRMLSPAEASKIQGGFTYSLSTGDRCQKSNMFTNDSMCYE
jgi:hypothetical protein